HIPLLMASDGRRLAKRDKELDLSVMRRQYDSAEPIIGYLAYLAGQIPKAEPISNTELVKIFNPRLSPTDNIDVPPQLPQL
ncbi:MAG: tRNA glutamyl-Q(34) synthetase GluQRS, partial [Phascolarctobacterium sp.]|nr:tRNA glutamyl-Q(34) synthetase GluQRS [Phascolarctobacterium sp.]